MSATFPNDDPFAPWTRSDFYRHCSEDVYCPWRDVVHADDPTAPWNNHSDPVPWEWLARVWNRANPCSPILYRDPDEEESGWATHCPFCFARNANDDSYCPHLIVAAAFEEPAFGGQEVEFEDEPFEHTGLGLPPLLDPSRTAEQDPWREVALEENEQADLAILFPEGPSAEGSKLKLYSLAAERANGTAISTTFDTGNMIGGIWTTCHIYVPDRSRFAEEMNKLLERLAEIRSASASASTRTDST